ncbi:nicotinamide riboside transporter PnuC [Capnocytophaga canimorsus]|uniref:nicotinamide riboside transporter PnuC n=1 Tax=Capnocytophaga canimorsus TaxID=28188 RepID=UPI00385826D2
MSLIFNWLFDQYKGVATHWIVLEVIGVIFGLLSVFFAKKRNIWVYPTGIVSTVIFVYLLWEFRLFGDMMINGYYTVMSVYGWVLWAQNSQDQVHVEVSVMNSKDWLISLRLALFSLVLVTTVYFFKPYINNSFSMEGVSLGFEFFSLLDGVDIITTAIFLVGMWLMAQRKIENWIFWIVGDLISVPLYYYKGLKFTSLQYLIFTIIAYYGYREWREIYRKNKRI